MLLLKLKLVPKGCRDLVKKNKLSVWLSTVVMVYHGQKIVLEETGIVESTSRIVSYEDLLSEVTTLLPTPVSGNYLVKLHA